MRKTYTDRGPSVPQSTLKSGKYGTAEEQAQGYQNHPGEMYERADWPEPEEMYKGAEWDEANEEMHRPFGHGGFLPRNSYRER